MTPNDTDVQTLLDHLTDLALELTTCNDTLSATEALMDACGCASNGTQSETNACAGTGGSVDDPSYNLPLHVGAVFIVLAVSSAGVALPILAARSGRLGVDGYWIQLGKLVGTGIVLACGLIHMLQPAAAALTGECVPGAFNEDYPAYAFLYCMIAALALHVFDTLMRLYMVESSAASSSASSSAVAAVAVAIEDGVKNPLGPSDAGAGAVATVEAVAHDPKLAGAILAMRLAAASHDLVLRRVVQSYSMEFAFTVHSIFIGLTVGVVDSDELSALLTALAFHQFFEGIALGSRLADAELPPVQTFLFALVFAVSAPVGIACGIAYIVSVNPDGVVYSLVQGTFDGVCAGFLLFVGFQLLLTDFPVDMAMHANSTKPRYKLRRFGMFLALWVGAGFMALIGRYL